MRLIEEARKRTDILMEVYEYQTRGCPLGDRLTANSRSRYCSVRDFLSPKSILSLVSSRRENLHHMLQHHSQLH